MTDLVMVIDQVDIETGDLLSTTRTTTHGWASPEEAVKHWRSLTSFTAHENGRITINPTIGIEARVYFDVPSSAVMLPGLSEWTDH